MQAADRQMLNLIIANLVGITTADCRAGNNLLWIALNETGAQTFLGDFVGIPAFQSQQDPVTN